MFRGLDATTRSVGAHTYRAHSRPRKHVATDTTVTDDWNQKALLGSSLQTSHKIVADLAAQRLHAGSATTDVIRKYP